MLEIIEYPAKILRKKTTKVKTIKDPEFQKFLEEMKETMLANDGIGLAANQVNSQKKVLVISSSDGPKAFINPLVLFKSFFKTDLVEEGCLSFPKIFGLVKRPIWIILVYRDAQANWHLARVKGMMARVLQHEINHLNGVLFIDQIVKYTKGEKKIKELISQASNEER